MISTYLTGASASTCDPDATASTDSSKQDQGRFAAGRVGHIVVNELLQVQSIDHTASELIRTDQCGLRCSGGMLSGCPPTWHAHLSKAFEATLEQPRLPRWLHNTDSDHLFGVLPLSGSGTYGAFPDCMTLSLLVIHSYRRPSGIHEVAARFHLSPAEKQLLQALCTDSCLSSFAQARHVSHHTVRSHLKSILSKLGVHSQIEAIRMEYQISDRFS